MKKQLYIGAFIAALLVVALLLFQIAELRAQVYQLEYDINQLQDSGVEFYDRIETLEEEM